MGCGPAPCARADIDVLAARPYESYPREVLGARLLRAHGRLETVDAVIPVKVEHLEERSGLLRELSELGDLIEPNMWGLARADEVKRPIADQRTVTKAADPAKLFPDGRNFR